MKSIFVSALDGFNYKACINILNCGPIIIWVFFKSLPRYIPCESIMFEICLHNLEVNALEWIYVSTPGEIAI